MEEISSSAGGKKGTLAAPTRPPAVTGAAQDWTWQ